MSEQLPEDQMVEYSIEKLHDNYPIRRDPMLISGPYIPASVVRPELDRLNKTLVWVLDFATHRVGCSLTTVCVGGEGTAAVVTPCNCGFEDVRQSVIARHLRARSLT